MISIYKRLLEIINSELDSFEILINADNVLGLNVSTEEIINYLEFSSDNSSLNNPIIGNIIITEGDILSILKLLNDLKNYNGEYILYINDDNLGTITYLVSRVNNIYKENNINVQIKIDYSKNYNNYLNELVTIVGSETFINECSNDFSNANKIIV